MKKLFPKNTIVKTPPYYFEHNPYIKSECKFCNKALDFETVGKDLFAYSIMYREMGSPEEWICADCVDKLNKKRKWNVVEYDWRIDGNEVYLVGKTLKITDVLDFFTARKNEWDGKDAREWYDHSHCTFCWEKFMIETADEIPFAYTADNYEYWICKNCYNDFKEKFKWEIAK